jgi:hypothetical protein
MRSKQSQLHCRMSGDYDFRLLAVCGIQQAHFALRQYIAPLMKPPIQDHIVVLLPVYAPVPLLLKALPYSQAARALAKSEWPKMPIPD